MRDARHPRKRRLGRPRLPRFDLRRAMFVLPNLFTVSSIFCGFYAMVLASGDPGPAQFRSAAWAVFFGILFDMADGRVARLTKTQSDFGIQLDSLADLVTFGAAPAVIVHKWGLARLGFVGVLAAFAFVACGAMRLARFNVLAQRAPGTKKFFVGLPIPLAAGLLVSLVMFHQVTYAAQVVREANILILILIVSYLMVSNIRYRTFKDLKPSARNLTIGLLVLAAFGAVAARYEPSFALLALFSAYITLGVIEEVVRFARRHDVPAPAGAIQGGPKPPLDGGGPEPTESKSEGRR